MPGDPELAKLIAAQAEGRDDCWILACDDPYLPIFYGTVNVWTFLGDASTRWISVALNQCCTTEDFLLFGKLIGDAIAQSDRRVVLLASGGMTHRFFPFRELRQHESSKAPDNILGIESYEADQRVLSMMRDGDHAGVIDWMPEYRKAAPEGHFGHYLMMASAIGGRSLSGAGRAVQRVRSIRRHGPGARLVRAPGRRLDRRAARPPDRPDGGEHGEKGGSTWQSSRPGDGLRTTRREEAHPGRRARPIGRLHGAGVQRGVHHPADRRRERRRDGCGRRRAALGR